MILYAKNFFNNIVINDTNIPKDTKEATHACEKPKEIDKGNEPKSIKKNE